MLLFPLFLLSSLNSWYLMLIIIQNFRGHMHVSVSILQPIYILRFLHFEIIITENCMYLWGKDTIWFVKYVCKSKYDPQYILLRNATTARNPMILSPNLVYENFKNSFNLYQIWDVVDSLCLLCQQMDESVRHLLFECEFSRIFG